MSSKNKISKEKILELYSDYLLTHGNAPKNVQQFSKQSKFEEIEFYSFFSSFEHIEREMIATLFDRSLELSKEFLYCQEMSTKEKLLNVYFIFFENLTLNRSLVLILLDNTFKNLNELRKVFLVFIDTLSFDDFEIFQQASSKFKSFTNLSRNEFLWLHLLSCIDFWKKDQSIAFESTDIFIEKSIDTGFDVIHSEPLKKVLDLGKFLWKERFN